MKRKFLTVLTVVGIIASGYGAYLTNNSIRLTESSLTSEDIEALSSSGEDWEKILEQIEKKGKTMMEKGADALADAADAVGDAIDEMSYMIPFTKLEELPCKSSEKTTDPNVDSKTTIGVSIEGNNIMIGGSFSSSYGGGSKETEFTGKYQYLCKPFSLSSCDRREQRDCDGNKIVD